VTLVAPFDAGVDQSAWRTSADLAACLKYTGQSVRRPGVNQVSPAASVSGRKFAVIHGALIKHWDRTPFSALPGWIWTGVASDDPFSGTWSC